MAAERGAGLVVGDDADLVDRLAACARDPSPGWCHVKFRPRPLLNPSIVPRVWRKRLALLGVVLGGLAAVASGLSSAEADEAVRGRLLLVDVLVVGGIVLGLIGAAIGAINRLWKASTRVEARWPTTGDAGYGRERATAAEVVGSEGIASARQKDANLTRKFKSGRGAIPSRARQPPGPRLPHRPPRNAVPLFFAPDAVVEVDPATGNVISNYTAGDARVSLAARRRVAHRRSLLTLVDGVDLPGRREEAGSSCLRGFSSRQVRPTSLVGDDPAARSASGGAN